MKKISFLILVSAFALFTFPCNAQTITTFAGNGLYGYSGDNGPATAATFSHIAVIDVDTSGNLFVPDYNNNVIRKVNRSGVITTIAGTSTPGYSGDGGPATAAELNNPWGITTDKAGNIYFIEHGNNVVRKINTAGIITTIAGNTFVGYTGDGGAATNATFLYPGDLAVDDTGNVYIADGNNVIRKVNTAGIITTIAGTGTAGYNGDGIPATSAQLDNPVYVMWGKNGNLYISDDQNNRIRMVNSSGIISTIVGNGTAGNGGDGGPATAAEINGQVGIALDTAGNLYLSIYNNNIIKKVTGTTISTIAGNGILGFSGDGGNPLLAEFAHPTGIAIDNENRIYIADEDNNRVRKIYGHTTKINNVDLVSDKMNIYPNPVNAEFTITSTESINNVTINNLFGQMVFNHDYIAEKKVLVDIASYPNGIYFIKVNNSEVRKIIKQ